MTTDIQILHEDDDVLIVNKPAGLSVHGDGRSAEYSVSDWIMEERPEIKDIGEHMTVGESTVIERPGIVHRLDKDTSGVLIIAKNKDSFEFLKKSFQDRKTEKTYRAIVYGEIKDSSGRIDKRITRSKKDFRAKKVVDTGAEEGRDALTLYKVIKRFDDYTYVEIYPKTGRMHQIRVHFKSIGHPILCDKLYAKGRTCPQGMGRHALHANGIQLVLPGGSTIAVNAEEPDDFKNTLAELESSC